MQTFIASLPMRNWNLQLFSIAQFGRLLRAYLWGIETFIKEAVYLLGDNCEPTYEELKPVLSLAVNSSWTIASLPMRNWNTVYGAFVSSVSLIASLPMRNWNPLSEITKPATEEVLRAYLWGIETPDQVFLYGIHLTLRAYLWGIET